MELRKIIESATLDGGIASLNEAKFNAKKLRKVSDLLASIMGREIGGGKSAILGGSLGYEKFDKPGIGKGEGFKYLLSNGKMLRFGFLNKSKSQYMINQVDLWDVDAKFNEPTMSVTLADWMNIVDVVGELKAVLSGKGIPSVTEAKAMLESAPKKMIAYADAKGVSYDGESEHKLIKKLKDNGAWDQDEYKGFKITTGVTEKNSTEKVLVAAEKKLSGRKYADPDIVFDDIEDLTKVVGSGAQNSMIIAGMAGVGKTFHVEKTLKDMFGSPKGPQARWRHRKGAKLSPMGLYSDLFVNRNDMTIVYDDSDSVWSDKNAINMLKSALDTYPVRELTWSSSMTTNVEMMEEEQRLQYFMDLEDALANKPEDVGTKIKLPSTFDFTSRVIFISNLSADKIDSAIRSRSIFIDVYLRREDVVRRIKSILPFVEESVDMETKLAIVDQLSESDNQLTMRAVTAAIGIKSAATKLGLKGDWERQVRQYI